MRSTMIWGFVLMLATAGASLVPSPAEAAFQGFMKIPGLPGESQTDGHQDEIDVVSYTQTAGTNACFKVIVIKNLDLASPGLAVLAVSNQVVSPVTIVLEKTGENPIDAFRAVLENVVVGTVELVEVDGSPIPTERVTLRPRRATLTYKAQTATGSVGATTTTVITCP
jgi:type VI protein secretion system component Hcp